MVSFRGINDDGKQYEVMASDVAKGQLAPKTHNVAGETTSETPLSKESTGQIGLNTFGKTNERSHDRVQPAYSQTSALDQHWGEKWRL